MTSRTATKVGVYVYWNAVCGRIGCIWQFIDLMRYCSRALKWLGRATPHFRLDFCKRSVVCDAQHSISFHTNVIYKHKVAVALRQLSKPYSYYLSFVYWNMSIILEQKSKVYLSGSYFPIYKKRLLFQLLFQKVFLGTK